LQISDTDYIGCFGPGNVLPSEEMSANADFALLAANSCAVGEKE
jgi:hypothetical protein